MKRLTILAATMGALLATTVIAAAHDDHKNSGNPPGGGNPAFTGHAPMGNPPSGSHPTFSTHTFRNGSPNFGGTPSSGGHPTFTDHRNFDSGHHDYGGPSGHPSFSYGHDERGFGIRPHDWNRFPRNFDRRDYQRNFHAERHFHWGEYHRPYGWYYRRWSYGDILPALFWGRDYWITDYWMFDLQIPPYGYTWVRYGDDALLINIYTGEVLEVEYGVFD